MWPNREKCRAYTTAVKVWLPGRPFQLIISHEDRIEGSSSNKSSKIGLEKAIYKTVFLSHEKTYKHV